MKTKKKVKSKAKPKAKTGKGILNNAINKLPFEIHIPGYEFCGPGTKLKKRLNAGQKGINGLDKACKIHDIAYSASSNLKDRHIADNELAKQAMARVKSKDAGIGEKIAALTVAGLTKVKSAIGAGVRKNKKKSSTKGKKKNQTVLAKTNSNQSIQNAIVSAKKALTSKQPKTMNDAINVAMKAAKSSMNNLSQSRNGNIQRIIPVPKMGGLLPLIPIFAGLSALGALSGGTAAVANAVITANDAKKRLKESQRHNEAMESIALGKNRRGDGVFLKPYRNGLGLYTHKKVVTKNS